MKDFTQLEQKLGITFENRDLLSRAFIHRSFLNENQGFKSNERLEYLGDAVLELAVTDYLFRTYESLDEGVLTSYRSALVRGANLSEVASTLELGQYLSLSKGEESSGGREKAYILANTVEALIGAIYLDQGYVAAKNMISIHIISTLDSIIKEGLYLDAKTHFQEKCQEIESITPHYELKKEEGPDHKKIFTVAALIGEREVAVGAGSNKQEAEQAAARNALKAKGWL